MKVVHAAVRLNAEEAERLERVRAMLAEKNPHYRPSVSDALRFCLGVASGSVAATQPIGWNRDGPS